MGSHIQNALEAEHKVVGLEARERFRDWYDDLYEIMDTSIDAIVHAGAILDNQSQDPNIYLWNSYATFLLAQRVRQKMHSMSPMPFIFFSTYLVGSTMDDWGARTPYTWSKAQAENFVRVYLPHATILRPDVVWGDEGGVKVPEHRSIPFRLASHSLKHLFRDWGRNYVHVQDVVAAVTLCLESRPKGTFDLTTEYVSNQKAATLVEWQGYEWLENPKEAGFKYILNDIEDSWDGEAGSTMATPPGWTPKVLMAEVLPRLERELNGMKTRGRENGKIDSSLQRSDMSIEERWSCSRGAECA